MIERSVTLHCTENGADKIYALSIEASEGGYVVRYANGRRGGTLTPGVKTKAPVPIEKAEKVYDSVLKEKLGKRYVPIDGDMPTFTAADARIDSGILPQLLNPIEASEAIALCYDPAYFSQIKWDGERCLIRVVDGEITAINRKGYLTPLSKVIATAITALPLGPGETLFDGERIGDTYAAFDLLVEAGKNLRDCSTVERHQRLTAVLANAQHPIITTDCATTAEAKLNLLKSAEADGQEGVVFKRCDAAYTSGRPASGGPAVKRKFYEQATCRVCAGDRDRRSVALELLDERGTWVGVGNVTIPANYEVPQNGALVEVRYLYFMAALFQPSYLGLRTDIDESECTLAQLKRKGEARAAA